MDDLLSQREKELPVSTIGKLLKIVAERKDIISLGAGELDVSASKAVVSATKKALDQGKTHYSPPQGLEVFRKLLAKKVNKVNKIDAGPENIIVTNGSTEGIFVGLTCRVDTGEGVLFPDPGFLSYKPSIEILNGIPISINLERENGFRYDVEQMEKSIIPEKTKAIILNSPCNPTGNILNKKDLEEIADFAVEHDLLILSDEAYENFVYDGEKHVSIGSLNGMSDRVLSLFSFSKSSAMPSYRIGYGVGPEKLIKAMSKVRVFTTLCTSTLSQYAAMGALKDMKTTRAIVKDYDKRRKYIMKRIKKLPMFYCIEPKGAFYVFPNIKEYGMSSMDFSEMILKRAGVAVVPGTEFGKMGEGFIRLSYATKLSKIKQAMDRIEKMVNKL